MPKSPHPLLTRPARRREAPVIRTAVMAPALAWIIAWAGIVHAQVPNAFEWPNTDFSKTLVDLDEILSGGPPKDGIPSIDKPQFVTTQAAAEWIDPREPVIVVSIGDDVRAYPIQILIWHEIANDTVGGVPISVTFCPLCNASIVLHSGQWSRKQPPAEAPRRRRSMRQADRRAGSGD